jgi:hypothetical protein
MAAPPKQVAPKSIPARTLLVNQAISPIYQKYKGGTFKDRILSVVDVLRRFETAPIAMAVLKGEDPFAAYFKGVLGKRPEYRIGYSEVLEELGRQIPGKDAFESKAVQRWAGLFFDVTLDPTTFVGVGGLTKLGQAAKLAKGAKAISLAGKTGSALRKAKRFNAALKIADEMGKTTRFATTPVRQALAGQRSLATLAGRAIVPRRISAAAFDVLGNVSNAFKATKAGQKLTELFLGADNKLLREIINDNRSLRGVLEERGIGKAVKLEKMLNKFPHKVKEEVFRAVEKFKIDPQSINQLRIKYGDSVGHIAEYIRRRPKTLLRLEQNVGVGTKELKDGYEYIARIMHPRTQRLLQKMGFVKKRPSTTGQILSPRMESMLGRKTTGLTADFVNDLAKQGRLTEIGIDIPFKLPDGLFVTDPAYALAIRESRHAKALSNQKTLTDIASTLGKKRFDAPSWFRPAKLSIKKGTGVVNPLKYRDNKGVLRDLVFDPKVSAEIEKHWTKLTDDKTMGTFLKGFDRIQNWWKVWTLGIFPAYHFRNVVGNVWNNFLAGVVNPTRYEDAARMVVKAKRGTLGKIDGKIFLEARKRGVLKSGWYMSNIKEMRSDMLKSFTKKRVGRVAETAGKVALPTRENVFLRTGLAVGGQLENNARLAHFIDKVKKGANFDEAAKSVKKYLFDYGELTDFERTVMRRFFPFYTWTRKNIPLQLEAMITRPGKFTVIEKTRKAVAGGREPERRYIPEWLTDRYAFRVGDIKDGVGRYFPLESWLPAADLVKLLRPTQIPADLLSPLIKTPLELRFNRSLYFKKAIERFPGERKALGILPGLMVDLPAKADYFLRGIRLINELDRVFGARARNLTKKEIAIRGMFGVRLTPQEISKAKQWYIKEKKKTIIELKFAIKRAAITGRHGEQVRLMQKLQKELASVR